MRPARGGRRPAERSVWKKFATGRCKRRPERSRSPARCSACPASSMVGQSCRSALKLGRRSNAALPRFLSGFDAAEVDSLAPARSALAGLHPAMRDKSFSPFPKWLKSQTAQVSRTSAAGAPVHRSPAMRDEGGIWLSVTTACVRLPEYHM